ncbi:SPFH domain-containing protein [Streptomyces sp. NPDC089919]|uniref:SPFH domain-containing protein n=1 Tax=Streptomyces sp. NPDC089919 TaxID=3155188 RepID=UPI003416F92E
MPEPASAPAPGSVAGPPSAADAEAGPLADTGAAGGDCAPAGPVETVGCTDGDTAALPPAGEAAAGRAAGPAPTPGAGADRFGAGCAEGVAGPDRGPDADAAPPVARAGSAAPAAGDRTDAAPGARVPSSAGASADERPAGPDTAVAGPAGPPAPVRDAARGRAEQGAGAAAAAVPPAAEAAPPRAAAPVDPPAGETTYGRGAGLPVAAVPAAAVSRAVGLAPGLRTAAAAEPVEAAVPEARTGETPPAAPPHGEAPLPALAGPRPPAPAEPADDEAPHPLPAFAGPRPSAPAEDEAAYPLCGDPLAALAGPRTSGADGVPALVGAEAVPAPVATRAVDVDRAACDEAGAAAGTRPADADHGAAGATDPRPHPVPESRGPVPRSGSEAVGEQGAAQAGAGPGRERTGGDDTRAMPRIGVPGPGHGRQVIGAPAAVEIPVHLLFRDQGGHGPAAHAAGGFGSLPVAPARVGGGRPPTPAPGHGMAARRAPAAPRAGQAAPARRAPAGDPALGECRGPAAPGWLGVLGGVAALAGCGLVAARAGLLPPRVAELTGQVAAAAPGRAHWAALAALGVLALVAFGGLGRGRTGHAWVLTLFGRYRGTVRRTGLVWVSPLLLRRRVDVRLRHWRSEPLAAVDAGGLALRVVVHVVWRVRDTARAAFAVEDHTAYLVELVESGLARVLSQLPADAFHEDAPTLRDAEAVGAALTRTLAADAEVAGIEVYSAQPTRIEYAPEVAAAMQRRRVAAIDAKHRDAVLSSVVDAVDDTVHRLTSRGLVELDDYERKALVKDLTVAFYTGRQE